MDAAAAHAQSDRWIRDLLDRGVVGAASRGNLIGRFAIGPGNFGVHGPDHPVLQQMASHLLPAISASGPRGGELDIFVLDGRGAPPPPWNLPHTNARHLERLHLSADGSLAAHYEADRRLWLVLDHTTARGLLWIGDLNDLPEWDIAAPFRTLLHWYLAPTPLVMVHAGAVASRDVGTLLVGPGGSGKSTTVAACFASGMSVSGDDLVVIGEHQGRPMILALHDAVKLDPLASFAQSLGFAEEAGMRCGAKLVYRYSEVAPSRLARQVPLRAIVRTEVAHLQRSSISPDAPAAALRALGPSTAFLLRGYELQSLSKIAALVRAVPGFAMRLSDDPAEAAATLAAFDPEARP